MFTVANSVFCQTKWHKEPLYSPLLEKAKFKAIEYKSTDYIAIGYVYKRQFIDGQNITFISKQMQDTIISGRYYISDNLAYIDGMWKQKNENGITRTYGVFQVKNADNEFGFTIKPKEGKPLQIETKDVFLYQGFRNKYPATLTKQDYTTYLLSVTYTDSQDERDYYKIEMKVDNKLIYKYGYYAINEFVKYITDVTRFYNNGDKFVGKVENTPTEDNYVKSELREGKFTHTKGETDEEELTKLSDGAFKYKVLYSNRKVDNNMAQMEIIVNKSLVEKYGYWAVGDYIYNTPIVKYTYKNGDVFEGEQEHKRDTVNANSLSIKSQLTKGKLKYATGEEFEGDLSGDWFCGVPISGTMKFTDGSVKKGNWFTQYGITAKQEVNEIEKGKSPTEKREIAKSLFKENQYQEEIHIVERALDNDDYESAKNAYANALKLKPENEEYINTQIKKIDKLQIEKRKRIAELKRKNALINKYGNYWGELIFNKEFTPGMTKEMVLEFTSDKCYKISKSIHSGMTIETWTFDKDKMQLEMLKESKNQEDAQTALGVMMIMGLAEGFGYNIRDQFPTLVFKNGKLTDVYQY